MARKALKINGFSALWLPDYRHHGSRAIHRPLSAEGGFFFFKNYAVTLAAEW